LLVALVATNWQAFQPPSALADEAGQTERGGEAVPAPSRGAPASPRADDTRAAATTAAVAPAAPAAAPALELGAVGGPTWLEVRAGDALGEQLHYDILPAGETRRFESVPVWVRVGAAGNLDIRIRGSRVRVPAAAPNGVVEFVVSADGVGPAR
jgi:hypothetical protein